MNPFHGRYFQGENMLWAVRWYCKYDISSSELQEMLAERGVNVDHATLYRWVQRYAPEFNTTRQTILRVKAERLCKYRVLTVCSVPGADVECLEVGKMMLKSS